MKKQIPTLFVLLMLVAAAILSRPAFAQTPADSLSVPLSKSLEVQISSSMRDGRNFLALDSEHPHLSVVLRNTSNKSFQLFEEWNSVGATSLNLVITAVDGKPLAQPLIVEKQILVWRGNVMSLQTLVPNQAIVRDVYFHVPSALEHPDTPPSQAEIAAERLPQQGHEYWFFPFSKPFEPRTVTMKAWYRAPTEATQRCPDAWTGVTESPLSTYEFTWGYARH